METVWRQGRQTVAEVVQRLNKRRDKALDYRTVLTVMSRLRGKGLLQHEEVGNTYHFSPTCSREEFASRQGAAMVSELVRQYGQPAIAGIVDGLTASPEALARLTALLEQTRAQDEP